MDYLLVKTIHQGAVALAFAGFFARGVGSLAGAAWVRGKAAKTLPHIVDTVLLLSALTLAFLARINPAYTPWLAAKIVALVLYIVLGRVALGDRHGRSVRAAAWAGGLVTLGWIISVAVTKSAWGFLRPLLAG